MKIILATVKNIIRREDLTDGELSMLLDIYNGTLLTSQTMERQFLLAGVADSFNLYPGMYEEKWKVDKDAMLKKLNNLNDWEAGCLQAWAVDFWEGDFYKKENSIKKYIEAARKFSTAIKF